MKKLAVAISIASALFAGVAFAEPPCEANLKPEVYRNSKSNYAAEEDFIRLGWGGEIDPSTGIKTVYYWTARTTAPGEIAANGFVFDCATQSSVWLYTYVGPLDGVCAGRVETPPNYQYVTGWSALKNTPRGTAGFMSCYSLNYGQ